ncbi:hypothetical protein A6V39_03140 [Candidatus Mycoplasma haematobovis]|uniref:Type I restriction modification DNA specificity domain-containing protein n=1 Tax=Candidatus Mycoplasma haematobovis TaxID=432608 RepID=A0A1A9QE52_9MOLU|nr:restriction endonuclease subunit S [Candidatus Mycoplasma haematobovis]OAL10404.1 hypothetical protein A6V39_03140 [Candidatus Mycoplasma haematobovis]
MDNNSKWEEVTLDKLGNLQRGKQTHKPENDPYLFENGNIPFVQVLCIDGKLFVNNVRKYYNKFGLRQSKLFSENTVCIVNHGIVAGTSILKKPSCLCTQLHGFNSFENVSDPKFVKYCFDFGKIKRLCQNISSAVSITKKLTLNRILKISFPNPPLDIQQKIGKILSTYDLLIENYEKQIDLLKNQRTKLFQRWFINHKFPNYIDTNPSNWKPTLLKDFVNFKAGPRLAGETKEHGLYPFFTCSKETQRINEYSFDQEALILSSAGELCVKYCVGKFDVMSQVYVLSLKHHYVYWLFEKINYLLPFFRKTSNSTTIPRLGVERFRNFKVSIPPNNLLNLFNKFAEPIQKQIDCLSKQVNKFQIIKNELIEWIYSQKLEIN